MLSRAICAAIFCALISTPAWAGERGLASWYGGREKLARLTACGDVFSPAKMTAAHRTLRCGTRVKVINLANNRTVYLTITDRGPHRKTGRIIDVTRDAAKRLGFIKAGTARVTITPLK